MSVWCLQKVSAAPEWPERQQHNLSSTEGLTASLWLLCSVWMSRYMLNNAARERNPCSIYGSSKMLIYLHGTVHALHISNLEFCFGVASICGTHSCVCVFACTNSRENSALKKMLIEEIFCYRAAGWIADKDAIVNETSAMRIAKGTYELFLLCLFIAP